jgi:hypothetical protein
MLGRKELHPRREEERAKTKVKRCHDGVIIPYSTILARISNLNPNPPYPQKTGLLTPQMNLAGPGSICRGHCFLGDRGVGVQVSTPNTVTLALLNYEER